MESDSAAGVVKDYGAVNAHIIGLVMREAVRRAIEVISDQLFVFERKPKPDHTGELNDLVTSADKAAQKVYHRILGEAFPHILIIDEEEWEPKKYEGNGSALYFILDPLDGTRAFARGQSYGIATMLALVENGTVTASCMGDAVSRELFYYRPESLHAHRLRGRQEKRLRGDAGGTLRDGTVLLRKRPEEYGVMSPLFKSQKEGGLFQTIQIISGSIGLSTAQLWNGAAAGAVIGTPRDTPWDVSPVFGLCDKLGFLYLGLDENGRFTEMRPPICTEVMESGVDRLVIHKNRLPELLAWWDEQKHKAV